MFSHSKNHREATLAAFGLQARRSFGHYIVPVVSVLSVGLLAGAGLGLFLAPGRTRARKLSKVGDGVRSEGADCSAAATGIDRTPEVASPSAVHFFFSRQTDAQPGHVNGLSAFRPETQPSAAGSEDHVHS